MEQYWRIAIIIAAEHIETFLHNLDEEASLILVLADEVREFPNAKEWLFKNQKWDENDELISRLLAALRQLPEYAFLYIKQRSPFAKNGSQGPSALQDIAILNGLPKTGNFFEDLNF